MRKIALFASIAALSLLSACGDNSAEPAAEEPTATPEVALTDEERAEVDALTQDIPTLLEAMRAARGAKQEYIDGKLAALITASTDRRLISGLWKRVPNFTAARSAAISRENDLREPS